MKGFYMGITKYWNLINTVFITGILFISYSNSFAENPQSAIGTWKIVDDKTQKDKAIVEIYEQNGKLYGRIIGSYENPDGFDTVTCTQCQGSDKGKKIKDLMFIKNMAHTSLNKWSKGAILDPDNGKVYNAKMMLKNDGKELHVRGFIGISLLGRTQIWYRIK